MSGSDDSDKTIIKPRTPVGSDKTQIRGRQGGGDKTQFTPRTGALSEQQQEERKKLEEQKRLAAQKKAKELEKRLAMIAAKKNQQRAAEQASAKSTPIIPDDDFLDLSPRPSAPEGDKTQFRPRSNGASQPAKNAQSMGDTTQFQARQPVGDSITQFKPAKRGRSDKTISGDATLVSESREQDIAVLSDGTEVLKGRFILEQVLGAGGMGVVYKARDRLKEEAQDRDPYVAVKVLSNEFKSHPEAFIALQRESRRTQRIAHPNIVNVHDFDRDQDTVFMTMEFLEGKPLDKLISQYKSTGLPPDEAWKVLEGISAALIYAHGQRIIHSDFKPGNIFVTNDGSAKVFDFGIARAVAKAEKFEDSEDDKTVFDAGNLGALTPAYASYEMLEGMTPDVRDDIYALGCIAYEMFTGEHPFNRVHANEAKRQKMKPKRIASITKKQWRVIEKSLAFEREDRIATVQEFWSQLTHKQGAGKIAILATLLVVVGLAGGLGYQTFYVQPETGISEDEVRSEIEREFQLSQAREELLELIATPEFTQSWENKLLRAVNDLKALVGETDPWLLEQIQLAYQVYLVEINNQIEEENFDEAKVLVTNARRYTTDEGELDGLFARIEATEAEYAKRIEEEKREQQQAVAVKQAKQQKAAEQKRIRVEFDTALATVNSQISCRSTMNIRDVGIAVDKLRKLDMRRYQGEEPQIVDKLSACILKVGESFPDRAEETKKRALRIFPDNPVVANIKIEPKDPCDISLAGLGSRGDRAICRDPLKNEGDFFGRGPSLIVIPGKGSVKPFAFGKYELTHEDLNKFCEVSSACSVSPADQEKMPVTNVDVKIIYKYAAWLSKMSKRKYRLPTKAEWTYAARANSSKLDSNRNCLLNSRGIQKGGVMIKATTGQQNAWGLVNHVGNVRETVVDKGSYSLMGGSYVTPMERCIVTTADKYPGGPDKLSGFRMLREIETK